MFGETFKYEKEPRLLMDGDYKIVLGKPYETVVAGYNVLRFPFKVDETEEEVIPNYFDLFDCTDPMDAEKVAMFNKNASRIKACFKLSGHFDESNYIKWQGAKGVVKIEKSKNGYVNVSKFYKTDMTEEEENNL